MFAQDFGHCVAEDVSIRLDERPPILLECRQILDQLLARHSLAILQ